MVTHRKSLLALMDTVYVLENGILRNVNELGGLDYYLQRLEGLSEQQVAQQIKEEKSYIMPDTLDKHVGLKDVDQPVQTVVAVEQAGTAVVAAQPSSVFALPHEVHRRSDTSVAQQEESAIAPSQGSTAQDGEVIIKLH